VDHEGEVLEAFVSKHRDRKAALTFLRKLMKRHDRPNELVTDKLRSYGAALKELGAAGLQTTDRWENNRAETSHQPFRQRERAMLRFRRVHSLQTLAAVHGSVHTHVNSERTLSGRNTYRATRTAALAEGRALCADRHKAPQPELRRGRICRIALAKYLTMRESLLSVLPAEPPGLTVEDAMAALRSALPDDLFPGGATAGSWLKAVQLDLEEKGVIRRGPARPVRLFRTGQDG
jgi:hypothetical protein